MKDIQEKLYPELTEAGVKEVERLISCVKKQIQIMEESRRYY